MYLNIWVDVNALWQQGFPPATLPLGKHGLRKPTGWRRQTRPHAIYRIGHPPIVVASARLAIEHALVVAHGRGVAAELPVVVGIVRTASPRQWCLGLTHAEGGLTWIGRHHLLAEAEAQVRQISDANRGRPAADPTSCATLVTEIQASGDTNS